MSNVEKLSSVLGFDSSELSAEKADAINALSDEEVQKIIELGGKIAHQDDEYGPFPI